MAFVKKLIRKGKHKENGAAVEALSKPTSLTLSTAIESSRSVPVISVPKAESDAYPSKKQSSGVSRKIQSNLELLGECKSEKTDTSSQNTLKDSNLQTSSEQLEAATTAKSPRTKPVPQPTDSAISNSKAEKNDAPPKLPPRDPKLQADIPPSRPITPLPTDADTSQALPQHFREPPTPVNFALPERSAPLPPTKSPSQESSTSPQATTLASPTQEDQDTLTSSTTDPSALYIPGRGGPKVIVDRDSPLTVKKAVEKSNKQTVLDTLSSLETVQSLGLIQDKEEGGNVAPLDTTASKRSMGFFSRSKPKVTPSGPRVYGDSDDEAENQANEVPNPVEEAQQPKGVAAPTSNITLMATQGSKRRSTLQRKNSIEIINVWSIIATDWDNDPVGNRKKAIDNIDFGINDGFRGLLWPMLAGVQNSDLKHEYVSSIPLESPYDRQIMKDLSRTFPEHELFKNDAVGQETLFRLMKAYALHDVENGYCQGMAFVAGILLMQMPEEDAFSVLVTLMDTYGLRGLFMPGVPLVGLGSHQFERLLEQHLPDVATCCKREGVNVSMFLTQWLMTLFAPSLPLPCVFHIMDYILAVGQSPDLYHGFLELFFRVALTLLRDSADEIVALTFDGILMHLKGEMKGRYRWVNTDATSDFNSPNAVSQTLVNSAIGWDLSLSTLNTWEKQYQSEKDLRESKQALIDEAMDKRRILQQKGDQLDDSIKTLQARIEQDASGFREKVEKLETQTEEYEQRLDRLRVHNVVLNDLVRIHAEG